MAEVPVTTRRKKRPGYTPKPETLALLKVPGNPINGLGEPTPRRPSAFFWHPPDQHPYGDLQVVARQNARKCPGAAPAFQAAYNNPDLFPIAGALLLIPPAIASGLGELGKHGSIISRACNDGAPAW